MPSLENASAIRKIPGVLGDLAASCFAFFFQRFHCRRDDRHQLHDDRGRDVRHDTECKHCETEGRRPKTC